MPPDRPPAPAGLTLGWPPLGAPSWMRRSRQRRPGEQPAGHVLVVMLAGLALAALVNADALVDRADRKPIGAGRDRSLAIWHPVQDVAHVVQLHLLRELGDALVGNEDQGGAVTPITASAPPTTVPPRPELRVPTSSAPLRLFVGGDSVVRDAGESLLQLASEDPLLAASLHYENATGLARPDFFDWPGALVDDMTEHAPEVAVIMFGGNDAQGIVEPDGTVHPDVEGAGWQVEYARRVAAVMDSLQAPGRIVLWIGQPPMRHSDLDDRMEILNAIFEVEARGRPWVTFVDTRSILGDDGRYAERVLLGDGHTEDLRQDDGIHLSRAGADRLARHLLGLIADEIDAARR